MTLPGKDLRYDRIRQTVRPGEKVSLKLSNRECKLILEHTSLTTTSLLLCASRPIPGGPRLLLLAG